MLGAADVASRVEPVEIYEQSSTQTENLSELHKPSSGAEVRAGFMNSQTAT